MLKRLRHTALHCSRSASVPCMPPAPPADSGHPPGKALSQYVDKKTVQGLLQHIGGGLVRDCPPTGHNGSPKLTGRPSLPSEPIIC